MSRLALVICLAALSIPPTAGAQTYDPSAGQSPLALLRAPEDGVAYHEAREEARRLSAAGDLSAAVLLWERLTNDYPRDPFNWMALASTQAQLGRHEAAAAAYERAGQLIGWDLEFPNGYDRAAQLLAAGDRQGALDALREMILERGGFFRTVLLQSPQFESLQDDPEFLEIIGRPDTTRWSRDEGWRHDVAFLREELKRVNPVYRVQPFPDEFERRYERLLAEIPEISDEEIFVGLQELLAILRQGHLVLFPPEGGRRLPLRFYAFPEGIFIIGAEPEYAGLVGARVLRIGSQEVDQTLQRLARAKSVDGDMQHLWGVSDLAQTFYLKGLGAIEDVDSVDLELQARDGSIVSTRIATLPLPPPERLDVLIPPPTPEPPLFLSRMDEPRWYTMLSGHEAMYVQVNNVARDPQETLVRFGHELWRALEEARPRNLILDLRHNNGGRTQSYPELLRTLVAYSRQADTEVYVLIGRRTYSAAGNLITDLERLADPIFVGEPSSECCQLFGDPISVTLPYSRIAGELTAVRWNLSTPSDGRKEIAPDVPVILSAQDYFAGGDPVMASVFELIRRGEARLGRREQFRPVLDGAVR